MFVLPGPTAEDLRLEGDVTMFAVPKAASGAGLCLRLFLSSSAVPCPSCGVLSSRVHSTYRRCLEDLAMQGVPVLLDVRVRRYRCVAEHCPRVTFAESLAGLAPRRAQRTQRLAALQLAVGLALGGEAGARLLLVLGASTSAPTLLRLVRGAALPSPPTPRVLGVDDWALRRGHRYGTLLIDQERRRPVALLPDREATTFAQWLREHPGVEIVTRDRAEAYAEGAAQGAPEAVQVADRWHLLKNVSDALERVLQRHRRALSETFTAVDQEALPAPDAPSATPRVELEAPQAGSGAEARRAAREALYETIQGLREAGLSIYAMSERLGLSRPTVRKYLRAPSCPQRAPRRTKIGSLTTFDSHLRARWKEGCRDATALWKELVVRGFSGSTRSVQRHVEGWSAQEKRSRQQRPSKESGGTPQPTKGKTPSPSVARWWLLLPEAKLSADQRAFVAHLLEQSPSVKAARELAVDFGQLLRAREAEKLAGWLQAAARSDHSEFRNLAASLRRDVAAVEAALREPWSNGRTEGHVHRLKLLKRQSYGRAKLDLLERRFLAA